MNIINCRAQVHPDCLDGKPSATQFFGEDLTLDEDGTYRSFDNSIVCDPCYIHIMPLTPSGQGLMGELDAAISRAWWDNQKALGSPLGEAS